MTDEAMGLFLLVVLVAGTITGLWALMFRRSPPPPESDPISDAINDVTTHLRVMGDRLLDLEKSVAQITAHVEHITAQVRSRDLKTRGQLAAHREFTLMLARCLAECDLPDSARSRIKQIIQYLTEANHD